MKQLHQPRRQAGSTLIVSVIMLLVLTMFVISAINSGTINLRIAGNAQAQAEARAAAQRALEVLISSSTNFYPTRAPASTAAYSINNDSSTGLTGDYSVAVSQPVCKRAAQQIPAKSLTCANGAKAGLFCWDTVWEVSATASRGGTSQTVTQGVSIVFSPTFVPSSVGC